MNLHNKQVPSFNGKQAHSKDTSVSLGIPKGYHVAGFRRKFVAVLYDCTVCTVCGAVFREQIQLDNHLLYHVNSKVYYCPFCTATCKDAFTYSTHLGLHFEKRRKCVRCPHCNKSLLRKGRSAFDGLRVHSCFEQEKLKQRHREQQPQPQQSSVIQANVGKPQKTQQNKQHHPKQKRTKPKLKQEKLQCVPTEPNVGPIKDIDSLIHIGGHVTSENGIKPGKQTSPTSCCRNANKHINVMRNVVPVNIASNNADQNELISLTNDGIDILKTIANTLSAEEEIGWAELNHRDNNWSDIEDYFESVDEGKCNNLPLAAVQLDQGQNDINMLSEHLLSDTSQGESELTNDPSLFTPSQLGQQLEPSLNIQDEPGQIFDPSRNIQGHYGLNLDLPINFQCLSGADSDFLLNIHDNSGEVGIPKLEDLSEMPAYSMVNECVATDTVASMEYESNSTETPVSLILGGHLKCSCCGYITWSTFNYKIHFCQDNQLY